MLGRYVEDSLPHDFFEDAGIHLPLEISAAAAPDPEEVLDVAIREATKSGSTIPRNNYATHFRNARNWGLALWKEFFTQLRTKICGKGKQATPLSGNANSALAALGVAVGKFLGLAHSVSLGIAVLVVTSVARVGKSALCKMTNPDELARYFAQA